MAVRRKIPTITVGSMSELKSVLKEFVEQEINSRTMQAKRDMEHRISYLTGEMKKRRKELTGVSDAMKKQKLADKILRISNNVRLCRKWKKELEKGRMPSDFCEFKGQY